MKPHILIPLLVVCVGLPLVVMGTYYVCDNFPTAEGMRKREVQYKEDMRREAEMIKEERRLARERAEEEKRQKELAEKRAEEERQRKKEEERRREKEKAEEERRLAEERAEKEKKLAAQKKAEAQQLAAQKKAEAQNSTKVTIKGISINLPREQLKQELAKKFGGIRHTVDGHTECGIVHRKAFRYLDYALLSFKNTCISFNEDTAFDGIVSLFPNCVRIRFRNETQFLKYVAELQKQYGDPADNYQTEEVDGSIQEAQSCLVQTRIVSDGIIHTVLCAYKSSFSEKVDNDYCVWYFGQSMRDYYMEKKGQAQREEEKQKKQKEEYERKRRARDAEGI